MSFEAQTITKVFQNIVSERTEKSSTTPMQTDLNTFSTRKITNVELVTNQNGVSVTLNLVLVKNKLEGRDVCFTYYTICRVHTTV